MATTKTETKRVKTPKGEPAPNADGIYFSRTKNDETDMVRVYLKTPRQWSRGFLQSRDAKALLDGVQFGKLQAKWVEKRSVMRWRAVDGDDASPQGGGGGGPSPVK